MARSRSPRNDRTSTRPQSVSRPSAPVRRSSPILSNATLDALAYGRTFKPLAAAPTAKRFDRNAPQFAVGSAFASERSTYSTSKKVDGPAPSIKQDPPRRDIRTCKSRPNSSRGGGGSRPFVPWCDRK